jgi:hypothetical protein
MMYGTKNIRTTIDYAVVSVYPPHDECNVQTHVAVTLSQMQILYQAIE